MPPLIPVHAHFMLPLLWAEVCGKPDDGCSSAAQQLARGQEKRVLLYSASSLPSCMLEKSLQEVGYVIAHNAFTFSIARTPVS